MVLRGVMGGFLRSRFILSLVLESIPAMEVNLCLVSVALLRCLPVEVLEGRSKSQSVRVIKIII
jgi:hypothetical protein